MTRESLSTPADVGSRMLRKDLASRFVERLAANVAYNINVMDASGTIIASTDPARVDTFHESAYRVVTERLGIMAIRPGEPMPKGTRPGVNLPIEHDGATIGVVGVTGQPDEVLSLAYAIKTSVETMIEHEAYKDRIFLRQNRKNLFLNLVLYERSRDLRAMQEAARAVEYSEEPFRVPVLFLLEEPALASAFLEAVKQLPIHTKQDISCATIDQDVLVFKVVTGGASEVLSGARRQVREYVDAALARARREPVAVPVRAFAGSRVRGFLDYSPAYEQVRWLAAVTPRPRAGLTFFEDHVEEYVLSRIPRLVLHEVFSETIALFRATHNELLLDTLRAVLAEDRNLQRAATRLGVHRNTVYHRLQKFQDLVGVDPLASASHARYFYHLARFLESGA